MSGENKSSIQWVSRKVKVSDLKPYEKNPRKVSKESYDNLLKSMREDGYHQRILTTKDLRVMGGHQRIKALKEIGLTEIEILHPDRDITDEQFKRILVRDNLDYGAWDYNLLAEIMPVAELQELGFDVALIGFVNDVKLPELVTDSDNPYMQMTFTLSTLQSETVKAALGMAKDQGEFVDTDNENSNGNALARICETYIIATNENAKHHPQPRNG